MSLSDISSVGIWKTRDRSFWIVAVLTVFAGLAGLDHFYLRSFKTGFLKILANVILLGSWYFWDIAQLVSDHKDIQEKGLRIPFSPDVRIGTGVILPPMTKEDGKPSESAQWNPPAVSILIYALLAIIPITGFIGADRAYAGSWTTAIMKFMLNIMFFGAWYFFDIYNVVVNEEKIVAGGLINPPPIGGQIMPGVFLPTLATDKTSMSIWQRIKKLVYSILTLTDVASTVLAVAPAPIPQTVEAAKAQITNAVETAEAIARVAEKGGKLLQKTSEMGPEIMGALSGRIESTMIDIAKEAATGHPGIAKVMKVANKPEVAAAVSIANKLAQTGGGTKTIGSGGAVVLAVLTIMIAVGTYQAVKLISPTDTTYPDTETATINGLAKA